MAYKNLWGIAEGRRYLAASLAITALFVFFEWRYNLDLLDTLSNPDATPDAVDRLSQRGKLLASLGITWVFGRILITRIKPAIIGLALFLLSSTAVYIALDQTYTRVIAGLKPEVKVEGFNLFSYRHDLLTGRLSDPDIPLPEDHPVHGKILMGSFPIVLLDDRFMLPAQDIVARKADDQSKAVLENASHEWPAYLRQMSELSKGYDEFITGSRRAYQYRTAGGIKKFQQRSGGLFPDPHLTRAQFVDMLRGAHHPQGEQLRRSEAREIGKRPDGNRVYARDLPYFMDRASYMNWFEAQASKARAAAMPTTQTVESYKGIRDINAAVFLPPMAIITSLTSALTNAVTLTLMLAALGLGVTPGCSKAALWLMRLTGPLMVLIVALVVLSMPSHVFQQGTPLYDLESLMHREVGVAGQIWSRLSGIQAKLLN
ncbi:MAG: hypothetical protein V4731_06845 [Pseudomonadota bacterium]